MRASSRPGVIFRRLLCCGLGEFARAGQQIMFFKVYAKWIDGQHDDRELAKIEAALRGE